MAKVAWWFWFLAGVKTVLAFLFFAEHPVYGTGVGWVATVALAFACVLVLLQGARSPWRVASVPLILVGYLAWCGVTLLWTPRIMEAGAYWLMLLLDAFIVFATLNFSRGEEVLSVSLEGFVWGTCLVGAVALAFAHSDLRLGSERLLHPNLVSKFAGLGSLSALYLVQTTGRRVWLFVAIGLGAVLVATFSKTSIIGFLVALPIVVGVSVKSRLKMAGLTLGLVMILGVAAQNSTYVQDYLATAEENESGLTFTGRTVLWSETFDLVQERPVLGYGFYSAKPVLPDVWEDFIPPHAHNEWLQQEFSLGIPGLVLALAIYVELVRRAMNCQDRQVSRLVLAVVAFEVVRGFTEAESYGLVIPLPLVILAFYAVSRGKTTEAPSGFRTVHQLS